MKFGKEFASQMVPEWHEAYTNYALLKTLLKDIQRFRQSRTGAPAALPYGLKRNRSLYTAFSGLLTRDRSRGGGGQTTPSPDAEDPVILITGGAGSGCSETATFLVTPEDGAGRECEMVYFRALDEEFNKVQRFFRAKVEEVRKEAEMMNKQMEALIAFRVKVENPEGWFDWTAEMNCLASDVAFSAAAMSATTPSGAKLRSSRRAHMEAIEEGGSSKEGPRSEEYFQDNGETTDQLDNDDEEVTTNEDHRDKEAATAAAIEEKKAKGWRRRVPAPLEILDRVKMNPTLETDPSSTIKGLLRIPAQKELKFSSQNLSKIEQQLKRAFVQFYHKLRLLKSYGFLNLLAFSKIMKKYDKITSRNASRSYMRMVDNSYLGSSDEVSKLMERVEATFVKHFANSNRSKGMGILRPKTKKERHRTTFSFGFFFGCTTSLILALIMMVRARNNLNKDAKAQYMDNMFPLYSLFGFIVLHWLLYAANIYFWRRYRVNYSFIFGFKQGTELGYREVLLLGFGLATLALASVLANLDMEMNPKTRDYKALTELIPLGVVLLVIVILFCPFNVIYRSSRFFFLTCAFHCICAPLYKVSLPDFFLADQLTSQVQAIRSLEFYICYYGWGDYKHRRNTCKSYDVYNTFYFIVAIIPYWARLLQCLRRLFEEKDAMQGYNGIKYFSTIVAVCARTAYSLNKGLRWRAIAWVSSGISAIFCTYWDLVIDWGLLQRDSMNPWLRDKLLVPFKSMYFGAMALNVLLRFAWLQTVLDFHVSFLHTQSQIAIVASLEIIRRGVWNFFRLENEHLNNVGKYRAFKTVPLPFNYDEDEDGDN